MQVEEPVNSSDMVVPEINTVILLNREVGTAVVTRQDGRLVVGKLRALCEQVKQLNSLGYEIILVSSGVVGLGRQRLRYRKLIHSSFADLQKPQVELDGKACTAVGQSSLMANYDVLFSQDSSGIFWDNDSLSALLVVELKADLLILVAKRKSGPHLYIDELGKDFVDELEYT